MRLKIRQETEGAGVKARSGLAAAVHNGYYHRALIVVKNILSRFFTTR